MRIGNFEFIEGEKESGRKEYERIVEMLRNAVKPENAFIYTGTKKEEIFEDEFEEDYMYYIIRLKRKYGNTMTYSKVGTEEKMMILVNHLVKDMNCKIYDIYAEDNSLIYVVEEPKAE